MTWFDLQSEREHWIAPFSLEQGDGAGWVFISSAQYDAHLTFHQLRQEGRNKNGGYKFRTETTGDIYSLSTYNLKQKQNPCRFDIQQKRNIFCHICVLCVLFGYKLKFITTKKWRDAKYHVSDLGMTFLLLSKEAMRSVHEPYGIQ